MSTYEIEARIASNIHALRRVRGMSTTALSEKCAEQGHPISRVAISRIEQLDRKVTIADAVTLAAVFGVPVRDLILGSVKLVTA